MPVGLRQEAFSNTYQKNRYQGLLFGYDSSVTKVGRQVTKNWCGSVLSEIKVPWTDRQLSKVTNLPLMKKSYSKSLIKFKMLANWAYHIHYKSYI